MMNSNYSFCNRAPRLTPGIMAAVMLLCGGLIWLTIPGCSKLKSTAKGVVDRATLKPKPTDLNVKIDNAANSNSPVALDVVLIKDKNFWKSAPAMSAKDWFAQKSDLQRRYGKKMQVQSWEWVPGQPIGPITVKVPRGLSGAMVFANYPTPGTHSAPLPLGSKININLQKEDFTMGQGK
jgi:type VI secretion system protein